jgi:hypothetical protein
MQRTTMVAIAAVLGLGAGVSAGFFAAPSPSESVRSDPRTANPTAAAQSEPSPGATRLAEETDGPVQPERMRSQRHSPTAPDRAHPAVEPSPLTFDAQATHCPQEGGGGALVSLYMTDQHLVYICQGGEGREDWRELDYYAINRTQTNDWIRLRAFVTSGPGVYAENGAYRYEINPTSLTVRENSSILLQEPVLRCKGNCS